MILTDAADDLQRLLARWDERANADVEVLALPFDRQVPTEPARVRAACEVAFAGAAGVAPFAALLDVEEWTVCVAAIVALVHRYSGATQVRFATATGGDRADEPVLSPLAVEIDGETPFRTLIARVAAAARQSRDEATIPLAVAAGAHSRRLAAVAVGWFAGAAPPRDALGRATGADLAFSFRRARDLTLTVDYNADAFDAASVLRIGRHLDALLAGAIDDPGTPVACLSLLSEDDRRSQRGWNATARPYDRGDLVDAVRACARATPLAVAVESDGETLTFGELDRRAGCLGAYLHARGVRGESLVGVFLERSVDMYVAVLGIQRAGAAYVPIDPAYPADRIDFMLRDCGASFVVTHERIRERLPVTAAVAVSLDRDARDIFAAAFPEPAVPSDPRRLAYTIYTSGSTGRPKGVLVEHGSVVNLLAGVHELIEIGPGDTLLALAPLAFDMSVLDVYLPLTSGARLVVASRETATNPRALIALMDAARVTHMQATPSAWRMLVEAGWSGTPGLTIVTGGEALPPALADRLLERAAAVWNFYGPTEATVWATAHRIVRSGERATIGVPMANVSTYILDPRHRLVPPGVIGELCIGGDGVARGYLNRPELTAERFIPDPIDPGRAPRVYKTGDVARYAADGSIAFIGRSDDQVKLRGYRIELGEVENALARLPGVRGSVAVVREDVAGDPRLVAYVTADTAAPTTADLRRSLQATLPAYMVPDAIVALESLPLNANGKVDRKALPAPYVGATGAIAARTPLEARLVAIWEDVLDLRPIGVTDDFFDLGATSITAARVFDRIERDLGAALPLSPLFQAPTIERLAALIERGGGERRWSSLVPVQPHGGKRPVFFVHGGAGTILHFHALAKRLGDDQPFYGFQMQGLYGDVAPHLTVEQMARHYIAEMRTVQATGPYALGGYCFGAIVAFEMARVLTQAGEAVALLATVNGPSPAYICRFGGPSNEVPAAEPEPPADAAGRALYAVKRAWWTLAWTVRWEWREGMRTRFFDARTRAFAAAKRPLPDGWRQLAIYRICNRAEKAYRAPAYDGAMLLVHGEGLYRREDLGWSPHVRGGVASHVVPGHHDTQRDAMFEPHVVVVASVVRNALAVDGVL